MVAGRVEWVVKPMVCFVVWLSYLLLAERLLVSDASYVTAAVDENDPLIGCQQCS